MTRARAAHFILLGLAVGVAAIAPLASEALTLNWSSISPGAVDGTTIGDLDGDGRLEVIALARGGTYIPGSSVPGVGGVGAFASDGTLLWVVSSGQELAGFPTAADFDGDGLAEVAYCEMAAVGNCHVIDGDGTTLYSVGPFYFPGMASSGPTATDINGDGASDLVISSWGGSLAAYDGVSGLQLWRVEAFTTLGELFFGHTAVISSGGPPALIVGGYTSGGLYAFDLASGALLWSAPGTAAIDGARSYGSGPAVADLDGDGRSEILVARVGAPPSVSAYSDSGLLLWSTPLPGASLYWMSPVIAEIDAGSPGAELLMQSGDGTLYKISASGTLLGSVSIGTSAWTAPSIVDANLDMRPDIVAGNPNDVVIVDGGSLLEIDRYSDPAGGLFPAPVIADLDHNGRVDFATASWWSHNVLALSGALPALGTWTGTAGGPAHTGTTTGGSGAAASGNPSAIMQVLKTLLQQIAALPGVSTRALRRSTQRVGSAYKDLVQGDRPRDVIRNLSRALRDLPRSIPGVDITVLQGLMSQAGILTFQNYVQRATAIMGPSDSAIVSANASLQQAIAQAAAGQYRSALSTLESAARSLERRIRYRSNFCPVAGSGPYLPWLCRLQTARDELLALQASVGGRSRNLRDAQSRLERAMENLTQNRLRDTVRELRRGAELIATTRGGDPSLSLAPMGQTGKQLTRIMIDDAIAFGISARDAGAAEAEYAAGVAAIAAGDVVSALRHFERAIGIARP